MKLTFEKEKNGNWYIVLPEWKGFHSQLQMVCGADTFLDMLQDEDNAFVSLEISLTPMEGYDKLEMIGKPLYGANYYIESHQGKKIYHEIWLCPVTTFVFGGTYPPEIYFKKD